MGWGQGEVGGKVGGLEVGPKPLERPGILLIAHPTQ